MVRGRRRRRWVESRERLKGMFDQAKHLEVAGTYPCTLLILIRHGQHSQKNRAPRTAHRIYRAHRAPSRKITLYFTNHLLS